MRNLSNYNLWHYFVRKYSIQETLKHFVFCNHVDADPDLSQHLHVHEPHVLVEVFPKTPGSLTDFGCSTNFKSI